MDDNNGDMETMVRAFVAQISDSIQRQVRSKIQAAMAVLHESATAGQQPTYAPQPQQTQLQPYQATQQQPRVRKRARVLCPVPGCDRVAAPVFGMLCAAHKDLPKGQIKQYRELRKLQKGQ